MRALGKGSAKRGVMNTHSQAESYRFARWKLSILVGIAACLFPALYTFENDLQSLA